MTDILINKESDTACRYYSKIDGCLWIKKKMNLSHFMEPKDRSKLKKYIIFIPDLYSDKMGLI